jgi:peptide-methionine (R)-S-oxide reductase
MKKEKEVFTVLIVEKNYLTQTQKYESGSGWPSFYQSLPDVFETKTDHLLGYARTEYHCKKCGGHHGHIFEDGQTQLVNDTVIMEYV